MVFPKKATSPSPVLHAFPQGAPDAPSIPKWVHGLDLPSIMSLACNSQNLRLDQKGYWTIYLVWCNTQDWDRATPPRTTFQGQSCEEGRSHAMQAVVLGVEALQPRSQTWCCSLLLSSHHPQPLSIPSWGPRRHATDRLFHCILSRFQSIESQAS